MLDVLFVPISICSLPPAPDSSRGRMMRSRMVMRSARLPFRPDRMTVQNVEPFRHLSLCHFIGCFGEQSLIRGVDVLD